MQMARGGSQVVDARPPRDSRAPTAGRGFYRGVRVKTDRAKETIDLAVKALPKEEGEEALFHVPVFQQRPESMADEMKEGKEEKKNSGRRTPWPSSRRNYPTQGKVCRQRWKSCRQPMRSCARRNEEMQSTNEEMQSTNEELETSREELQSVNEELTTV